MVHPDDIDSTATEVGDLDETSPGVGESIDAGCERGLTPDAEVGPMRLGRYVLLREIGAGAIGVVYAAYHEGLDRKLAIKVLNRQRAGRVDLEARLRREAKALAKLSHPNVVQVYDVGEHEGRVFVAMEFVEGEPLSDWMRRKHSLDEKVAMFVAAGRGLAAAHEAGVIHRDFKPDNVLVGTDGRPRVLDFGLARAVERSRAPRPVAAVAERPRSGPLRATLAQLLSTGPTSTWGRSSAAEQPDPEQTDGHGPPPLRAVPEVEQDEPEGLDLDETIEGATNSGETLTGETSFGEHSSGEANVDLHALTTQVDHEPEHDATPSTEQFAATVMSEPGPSEVLADDGVVTRDGALMGTPAYMSPEQFLGRRVNQASDQFSFCVALYEALYGHRPFAGKNPMELALQTQSGSVADAPPNSEVPIRLRQIVLRGLSPRPDDRFESMDALIAALEHDPSVLRRRRWLTGVAAASVVAIGATAGLLIASREPPCPSVDAVAVELWNDEHISELRDAFTGSPLPYALASWALVEARLSEWSHRWATQRVDACEATHVRHEFTAEVLDRRQACLDRGRRAFTVLLEQLGSGEATVIERAIEAAAELPEPTRCGDVETLLGGDEPPASVAGEVAELRQHLAGIQTLANTGRSQQGLAQAKRAVEQARETGYGRVVAEALFVHGRLLTEARAGGEALDTLQAALDEAERHGHDQLVPSVAIELASLSSYTHPDPVRGRLWARRALTALDRIDERGHARARGIWALGKIELVDGINAQAEDNLRQALALLDEHAADHPDRAVMLNDLGNILAAQGRHEAARETYEQALERAVESFGPGHPRVGHARFNLARLAHARGDIDEARAQLDLARQIYLAARGPGHRDVGTADLLATNIALAEQRYEEAARLARQVKAIYEVELAPDNVDRAEPDLLLGHIAFFQGQVDEALDHYRASLALQRATLPAGHIALAGTLTNIGSAHLAADDPEPAVEPLTEALALLEAGERVNPGELRLARMLLGEALARRAEAGDLRRAAPLFEAAFAACGEPPDCAYLALRAAQTHRGAGDHSSASRWANIAIPLYRDRALEPTEQVDQRAVLEELAALAQR
jgi:eukaryotic-like serine/threonine-protein kinase